MDLGRVNRASNKSAVKLQEVGPRMTLQLVKVEEGLCSGSIIFDAFGKHLFSFKLSIFQIFMLSVKFYGAFYPIGVRLYSLILGLLRSNHVCAIW